MKRALGLGAAGLLAFGMFFIAQTPASALIDRLRDYLPGLAVSSADGTLYHGQALDLTLRGAPVGALSWRWRPLALLRGALAYTFSAHASELDLRTEAHLDLLGRSLRLAPLTGKLPLANAIALAGHPPPPLNGTVELALDEITLTAAGGFQAAAGTIHLRDLHTAFGRTLRFGDFSAQLRTLAANQGINGLISNAGGPLTLRGDLTLAPDGGYRFSGEFGVRDAGDQELRPILAGLLGAPGPNGQWQITLSGRLTL